MDILLHLKVIKTLSLEYLHKFNNCVLILLCRLLTHSKLPPASHHTSACSYWTQPAGGLFGAIELGGNSCGKGSDRWVCLRGSKDTLKKHPQQTTSPQANLGLASVIAASISWGASQKNEVKSVVQFPFNCGQSPHYLAYCMYWRSYCNIQPYLWVLCPWNGISAYSVT